MLIFAKAVITSIISLHASSLVLLGSLAYPGHVCSCMIAELVSLFHCYSVATIFPLVNPQWDRYVKQVNLYQLVWSHALWWEDYLSSSEATASEVFHSFWEAVHQPSGPILLILISVIKSRFFDIDTYKIVHMHAVPCDGLIYTYIVECSNWDKHIILNIYHLWWKHSKSFLLSLWHSTSLSIHRIVQ